MATENVVLMSQARESLKGKWGLAIGAFVVYSVIAVIASLIPGGVVSLLISGPLAVGVAGFFLALSRTGEARISQVFDGFNKFGKALGAYLLMLLFILLWMLLLIVPGIIAAFSYAMVFNIIADDDSIKAMDALKKSKAMMDGYKMKYFFMNLRFIGWALLCILTLGIGFLWLYPYIMVTHCKFYDDIKGTGTSSFGTGADQPLDAGVR